MAISEKPGRQRRPRGSAVWEHPNTIDIHVVGLAVVPPRCMSPDRISGHRHVHRLGLAIILVARR